MVAIGDDSMVCNIKEVEFVSHPGDVAGGLSEEMDMSDEEIVIKSKGEANDIKERQQIDMKGNQY